MTGGLQIAVIALLVAGVLVVALSALGVLVARETFLRLHYLGPASTVGAPLIIAALVLHEGWQLSALKLVLIGVLLVGSGVVTVSALGRAAAQREQLIRTDRT